MKAEVMLEGYTDMVPALKGHRGPKLFSGLLLWLGVWTFVSGNG